VWPQLTGSSELAVLVTGGADASDQACLFLQLAGTTWVKVGIEFDGQLLAGGVVTYPYSDWYVGRREYASLAEARAESRLTPGRFIRILEDLSGTP